MNAQAKVTNIAKIDAATVRGFASSLGRSVIGSLAMKLGNQLLYKTGRLVDLKAAEVRFGRAKIDLSTNRPASEGMEVEIERIASEYQACMNWLDMDGSFCTLDALVERSSEPYVKGKTPEQWAIIAECAQQPIDTLRKQQYDRAVVSASRKFSQYMNVLDQAKDYLYMAPDCDLEDIEIDWAEIVENKIKAYRAKVVKGEVWDDADIFLFNQDVKALGL